MKYLVILLLSFASLFAYTLQKTYITKTNHIYASDIIKNIKQDFLITQYDLGDHVLSISTDDLIDLFKQHGYTLQANNLSVITFKEKSPIDVSRIIEKLKLAFLHKYPNLQINTLNVYPMSYMKSLPKSYTVVIPDYALSNNYSTLYIVTPRHREFFFNFTLDAKITLFVATKKIKRHTQLTGLNTRPESVHFKNFQGTPVTDLSNHLYQSKFTIQSGSIILRRNIEPFDIVRRNKAVVATITDGGVSITFNATAMKSGRKGDVISIRRDNGKQLTAVITGPNMVQVQ